MLGFGITICLVMILSVLASWWIVRREVASASRRVAQQLTSFVSPVAEGQPSPLAQLTQLMGQTMGQAMALQLKTMLMGTSSSIAKAETALAQDAMLDQVEAKNPLLALLLQSFPRVAKRLSRSPAAATALSQLDFGSIFKGEGQRSESAGPGGGNHRGSWDF